jgi:hypothetical protein
VTAHDVFQAITANRLTDGAPVYFTAAAEWSAKIGDAAHAKDASALLAEAQNGVLEVVAPYIVEVEIVNGEARPIGLREQIRAYGPSA